VGYPDHSLSRRHFLVLGAGLASSAVVVASTQGRAAAAPAESAAVWTGSTSANGWPIIGSSQAVVLEGTDCYLATAVGAPSVILGHVARRFSYEIDTLRPDDISSWTADPAVTADFESNYLSGTAIAIRPGNYPLGVSNCYYANELIVVRDILAECEGVVRWGGDENIPKECHFQIDAGPNDSRVTALASKISNWSITPGKGAGTIDPFLPQRRRAADAMENRQAND
jgi:hypothetical protein